MPPSRRALAVLLLAAAPFCADAALAGVRTHRVPRSVVMAADASGAGRLGRRTMRCEFTCRACDGRTVRMINPDVYRTGTCLVQCEHCGKHHIIADNLDYIERGFKNVVEWGKANGIPDILLRDVEQLTREQTTVEEAADAA